MLLTISTKFSSKILILSNFRTFKLCNLDEIWKGYGVFLYILWTTSNAFIWLFNSPKYSLSFSYIKFIKVNREGILFLAFSLSLYMLKNSSVMPILFFLKSKTKFFSSLIDKILLFNLLTFVINSSSWKSSIILFSFIILFSSIIFLLSFSFLKILIPFIISILSDLIPFLLIIEFSSISFFWPLHLLLSVIIILL